MMKKARCVTVSLIILTFLFAGCNQIETSNNAQKELPEIDISEKPTKYQGKTGNITFDMDILIPNEYYTNGAWMGSLSLLKYNDEKIIEAFPMTEARVPTAEEVGYEFDEILLIGEKEYLTVSKDSSLVHYEKGESIEDITFAYKYAFNNYLGFENYNGTLYFTGKDFDFASTKQAISAVIEKVQVMGFEIGEDNFSPSIYSLDHEIMKEEAYFEDYKTGQPMQRQTEWSSDDDCYYITLHQKLNGFRLIPFYNSSPTETDDSSAAITALYTKEGIQEFRLERLYDIKTQEQVELAPFSTIIKTIDEKYNQVLSDTTYNIDNAELINLIKYTENGDFVFEPVWAFRIIKTVPATNEIEERIVYKTIIINAVTGKDESIE